MKNAETGTTPSERYLSALGSRAFLGLWKYMNPYRGLGKELCDMLVVFGNHVLIFSVKDIAFDWKTDLNIAWARWYKKAIDKSAQQIFGAEAWIRQHPERIFLDAKCERKFPIAFNPADIKIHRICIALGVCDACAKFYGGNDDTASLPLLFDLNGAQQHKVPFALGHPCREKGIVHVFDDSALNIVFSEIDTVVDFVDYLSKREKFVSQSKPVISTTGEEELLAIYLTNINDQEKHDFVLPESEEDLNFVFIDQGQWRASTGERYLAKKEANKISYLWDELINHLIRTARVRDENGQRLPASVAEVESNLRYLAETNRLVRRNLAETLCGLIKQSPAKGAKAVTVCSYKELPDKAYVLLLLPRFGGTGYEETRTRLLTEHCIVAKLKFPQARHIIGLAFEPPQAECPTEALWVLDTANWGDKELAAARELQEELSLLKGDLQMTKIKEYPK